MIHSILLLLSVSFVSVAVVRHIGLSPIVGFILTGVVIGPQVLGVVDDSHAIRQIGEIGIVFLMFTIGLEFSLSRLAADRFAVLVLGGLQVLLTTAAFALIVLITSSGSVLTAITIGMAMAMSSTAIVSRMLIEEGELKSRHGRTTICILLFQDLATIIFLMVMPALNDDSASQQWLDLSLALAKGAAVFLILLFAGRLLIQRSFRYVARIHSPELFMLAVLVVSIGAARFAQEMGLSLALGGFMAGMVLGETEFRHQVEADIRPFQDVLLGLFFITIGMLVDLQVLSQIWPAALAATAGLILTKAILVFALTRISGTVTPVAARTGLILAHGGEFGLMLTFLAMQMQLLGGNLGQIVLAAILLSMVTAPIIFRHSAWLARRLSGIGLQDTKRGIVQRVEKTATDLSGHVILCGYGRVGRNIAWYLDEEGIEYVALDIELRRLKDSSGSENPVTYGDATQSVILRAAGLEQAQAIVIAFDDVWATLKTLSHVRTLRPDITAIVRATDEESLDQLLDAGATEVIPDTLEISLTMATHVLTLLGVPVAKVAEHNERIRADRYRLLRGILHGHQDQQRNTRVRVVTIRGDAYAVGRRLLQLRLDRFDITVSAIRRHGIRGAAPDPELQLAPNDVLIVSGTPDALSRFEDYLQHGP